MGTPFRCQVAIDAHTGRDSGAGEVAVAAVVAQLPGALIVESLWPTSEPSSAFNDSWIPQLELLGRALMLAISYALVRAPLTLSGSATRTRRWAS